MKLEHLVALAVRLFAIVLALYAIRNGISLVPQFQKQGWEEATPFYIALMTSLIFLSVILWKFPLTVARGLVNFRESSQTNDNLINKKSIEAAAYTVLGLYLLFGVLSDAVYWATMLLLSNRNPQLMFEFSIDQKATIFTTVIEFIFVLFLIFGSRRLVELFNKLKYGK